MDNGPGWNRLPVHFGPVNAGFAVRKDVELIRRKVLQGITGGVGYEIGLSTYAVSKPDPGLMDLAGPKARMRGFAIAHSEIFRDRQRTLGNDSVSEKAKHLRVSGL